MQQKMNLGLCFQICRSEQKRRHPERNMARLDIFMIVVLVRQRIKGKIGFANDTMRSSTSIGDSLRIRHGHIDHVRVTETRMSV